jgi:hypothetical protein
VAEKGRFDQFDLPQPNGRNRREAVDSAGFVDGKPGNTGIRTKSLRELIDCFGNAGTAVRNF